MSLFSGKKSNQKCPSRAQDSGAYCHTFATKRSYVSVLEDKLPSFHMSNEGEVRKAAQAASATKLDCSQHPFLTCAARSSQSVRGKGSEKRRVSMKVERCCDIVAKCE